MNALTTSTLAAKLARWIAFTVAFASGASGVWLSSGVVLDASGATRQPMTLDILYDLRRWQERTVVEFLHQRVALVGDSVLLADVGTKPVGMEVARAFRLRGERSLRPTFQTLAWPGLGPIAEYCLADEIVDARPNVVVLEANLRGLRGGPLGPIGFPELAGYIRSARLLEAMSLPLADAGITLDRLLFYRAIVAGGFERERVELLDRQARALHLRDKLEEAVEAKMGSRALFDRRLSIAIGGYSQSLVHGRNRAQERELMKALDAAVGGLSPDSARLRVLAATVRSIRKAGIPVLVWVAPVNVEYLQSIGVRVDGIARSVAAIRTAVVGAGAAFADLHWLLPDAAFRDSGDHVTTEGPVDGSAILGSRLASEIAPLVRGTERLPGWRPIGRIPSAVQ